MNYIPIIEKALDYVERHVSDDLMTSIAKGRTSVSVYSDELFRIILEKDTHNSLPNIQIIQRMHLTDHWVGTFLPAIDFPGYYRKEIIRFFKDLMVYSRVCQRLGYDQIRLNFAIRFFGEDSITLKLPKTGQAQLSISINVGKLFVFRNEDEFVRKVAQFERDHSTVESISTMNQELKSLVIGVTT